jgi:HJR/Mrr/RecB family endonuclease
MPGEDPFAPDTGPNTTDLFQHARDFEVLVLEVMRRFGYTVTDLAGRGDHGVDILAEKNGIRTAVQVKCYTNSVGVRAVQATRYGMRTYQAAHAIVVTNSRFTHPAKALAREEGVKLIDGAKLRGFLVPAELEELTRIEARAVIVAPQIAQL